MLFQLDITFLLTLILLFFGFFSFGRFGGSKDIEKYKSWSEELHQTINEGSIIIDSFKEIVDKESTSLDDYNMLEDRLNDLNPEKFKDNDFSLKKKDKESYEKDLADLKLFTNDYDFFLKEISIKKQRLEKVINLNNEIDTYQSILTENESRQQLLARTIPRLNTTSELNMVEDELTELQSLLPKKLEDDPSLPDELQIRIERINLKFEEWYKKLDFVEKSITKYRSKVENSVQEQVQKENLSKIHTWLDSSETRIIKLSDKIKKVNELVNDESTSSKALVNSLKDIEKLSSEILEIKPPGVDLVGEKQTQIGIDFRLKELSKLNDSLLEIKKAVDFNLAYRIAFIRSSILEKMFLKSHQLSYKQVNYSLGYKNELLMQGWLDTPESEPYCLKNYQNKYLMLSKENISSLKESSEKIFESLQALTSFEQQTSEQSYNQSLKWLLQNDDKWANKN